MINAGWLTPLFAAAQGTRQARVDKSAGTQDGFYPMHIYDPRAPLQEWADSEAERLGHEPVMFPEAYAEVVRVLLDAGATVKPDITNTWTVLHAAAAEGRVDVVRELCQGGADPKMTSHDGATPLHFTAISLFSPYVSETQHVDTARILLEAGARVNARMKGGQTPLHRAAIKGHQNVATVLLINEANIDAQDHEGNTPLHLAARRGHTRFVEFLISRNATLDVFNRRSSTPADEARMVGHRDIDRRLRDASDQDSAR